MGGRRHKCSKVDVLVFPIVNYGKSKTMKGRKAKIAWATRRKWQTHARMHAATGVAHLIVFLCLYYWCWARYSPTQPSVHDSPTFCPLCFMPTTTFAGWHKHSNAALSKCERLINIPRYLGIGCRWHILKRDMWGKMALICAVSWMTSKARIDLWCEIQSCHDYLSCKQNWHPGVLHDGLSMTFCNTSFRGSSNCSPLCFRFGFTVLGLPCTTKAKLPGESGEWSHDTSHGASWDRGHMARVFANTWQHLPLNPWM